jgi:hypothetical protein
VIKKQTPAQVRDLSGQLILEPIGVRIGTRAVNRTAREKTIHSPWDKEENLRFQV